MRFHLENVWGNFQWQSLSCHKHLDILKVPAKSLNYLRHSLWGATHSAKAAAYVSLVRPLLEYACTVWNPHACKDQLLLEQVQQRAAWWVCGSRWSPTTRKWSKSSADYIAKLSWPALSACRNSIPKLIIFLTIQLNAYKLWRSHTMKFLMMLITNTSRFIMAFTIQCIH